MSYGRKSKSDITGKPLGVWEEFDLQETIGITAPCEDGKFRRVVEITPSFQFHDKCVINESDPDSDAGYFVHYLDLCAVVKGTRLPTKEEKEAFSKGVREAAEELKREQDWATSAQNPMNAPGLLKGRGVLKKRKDTLLPVHVEGDYRK